MNFTKVIILLFPCLFIINISFSQTINWANFPEEQHHIVHLNAGLDYGMVLGVGYGYKPDTKIPVILNLGYSFPSGNKFMDDFKSKMGAQIMWYKIGNFQVSTEIQGVFRRYQNPFVRLLNFGSDLSGTIGYYKPGWFMAGEFGFDKAIVTHFNHPEKVKNNYPLIQDGWYQPSTGGNFYYGLQAGYSFIRYDLNLKVEKLITQVLKTTPTLPFYARLCINVRF